MASEEKSSVVQILYFNDTSLSTFRLSDDAMTDMIQTTDS